MENHELKDKVKRERSANFSLNDRDILVQLVQKYQDVLENKQSDASTWKKKEAAWESIEKEYNARSGGTFRSNKKWDVTSRRNLKLRKHPALIANVPKKTLFNEVTQAKLELVQLQKEFLEAEIVEKKKVWEFEASERKKESEFKEKERKWKEEEYKLKLEKNFK